MDYARVTVNERGHVTPESTATFKGRSLRVPDHGRAESRLDTQQRISMALGMLLVRAVPDLPNWGVKRVHGDGYVDIPVVPVDNAYPGFNRVFDDGEGLGDHE